MDAALLGVGLNMLPGIPEHAARIGRLTLPHLDIGSVEAQMIQQLAQIRLAPFTLR